MIIDDPAAWCGAENRRLQIVIVDNCAIDTTRQTYCWIFLNNVSN